MYEQAQALHAAETARRAAPASAAALQAAAAAKAVVVEPQKLFNKVVRVSGHTGFFFVLTFIPDLQWCRLAPMEQRGRFSTTLQGSHAGAPKWMLAREGEVRGRLLLLCSCCCYFYPTC